jgi:hypothetical protein
MRTKNVGVLAVLVLGAMLMFSGSAIAESLWWTGPTTFTDGSLLTTSEKASLTYYVRIDKSNPRDTTGTAGWFYLGETRNGGLSYPSDNSLGSLMRSFGYGGTIVNFTVSAAFNDNGVERDSAPSTPPLAWTVPLEKILALTFSLPSGLYNSNQTITISTATPGVTIRYGLNGVVPTTTTGTIYTGPITTTPGNNTIIALAYKTGMANSDLATATYNIIIPVVPKIPAVPTFTIIK